MNTKPNPAKWEIEPWINGTLAIVSQDNRENEGEIIAEFSGVNAKENAEMVLASLRANTPVSNADTNKDNLKST